MFACVGSNPTTCNFLCVFFSFKEDRKTFFFASLIHIHRSEINDKNKNGFQVKIHQISKTKQFFSNTKMDKNTLSYRLNGLNHQDIVSNSITNEVVGRDNTVGSLIINVVRLVILIVGTVRSATNQLTTRVGVVTVAGSKGVGVGIVETLIVDDSLTEESLGSKTKRNELLVTNRERHAGSSVVTVGLNADETLKVQRSDIVVGKGPRLSSSLNDRNAAAQFLKLTLVTHDALEEDQTLRVGSGDIIEENTETVGREDSHLDTLQVGVTRSRSQDDAGAPSDVVGRSVVSQVLGNHTASTMLVVVDDDDVLIIQVINSEEGGGGSEVQDAPVVQLEGVVGIDSNQTSTNVVASEVLANDRTARGNDVLVLAQTSNAVITVLLRIRNGGRGTNIGTSTLTIDSSSEGV